MLKKAILAFLPLMLLILLPVVLRTTVARPVASSEAPEETLVIISPHSQAIRYEFSRAFKSWYYQRNHKTIEIEWRTPGGTSDIVRYIDDLFMSSFRRYWEAHPELGAYNSKVAYNFNNRRIDLKDSTLDPDIRKARETFLASDVGIGIDLFFGGGQYEMDKQAKKGNAVDAGVQKLHPDWFSESVIPRTFGGETFYDVGGRYYGTCLAAFGICYNRDRLKSLKNKSIPDRWTCLGEPRFLGQVVVADPTKSGSINKCFEMLIQQQMAGAVKRLGNNERALCQGWADGLNLVKRIGGNARNITESASKVPRTVAAGDAAVGMCIDVYGRTEAEWTRHESGGRERLVYVDPVGGTSFSTDPILLFRGAPHRDAAVAFIEFVLSIDGQKLWDYRLDTPGGPHKYALRRMPIRKDMYVPKYQQYMSDGGVNPYRQQEAFVYRGGWTGPNFGLIRVLIKSMIIEPLPELQDAWYHIVRAGGPEAVPEAMKHFNALPFSYSECGKQRDLLVPGKHNRTELDVLRTRRLWSEFFRKEYRLAAAAAKRKGDSDEAH